MGAIHRLDLTTDVTHLIVGQTDTPKYKHVAKERRDIQVLQPGWIEAVRDHWKSGDDFDVEELVQQYKLPVFSGLDICVTGFDDVVERSWLQDTASANGATYHGDLTRIVTHLVAARPHGAKYERAREWGLKLVSRKWFEDCLERGMILEEKEYDPRDPIERQGVHAFDRNYRPPSPTALAKRKREEINALHGEPGKRKMRRTASTRINSQSQSLWAGLSGLEPGDAVKQEDQWDDDHSVALLPEAADPATAEIRFDDEEPQSIAAHPPSRPVSRATSRAPISFQEKRGLFSGCLCYISEGHPAKRHAKLVEILAKDGAQLSDTPEDLFSAEASMSHDTTVIIFPSEWTLDSLNAPVPDVPEPTMRVTEWWVERCIIHKSIVNADEDVLSRPRLNMPSKMLEGFHISTSGLDNDVKSISKIVGFAGGVYEEQLKPSTTMLVIRSSANREKIEYAAKYHIPVVSEKWLLSSIARGRKLDAKDFPVPGVALGTPGREHSVVQGVNRAPEQAKRKDDPLSKRLSATRKKAVTPTLQLVRSRPLVTARKPSESNTGAETTFANPTTRPASGLPSNRRLRKTITVPFLEDDDDDDLPAPQQPPQLDGPRSQALQEIAIELNSPPKQRPVPASEKALEEAAKDPTESKPDSLPDATLSTSNTDPTAQPPSTEADRARLTSDIRTLLTRRREHHSTTTSASASPEKPAPRRHRNRDRALGRALSNISNPASAPLPPSRSSTDAATDHTAQTHLQHSPATTTTTTPTDIATAMATAMATAPDGIIEQPHPPPSQHLSYETADAAEHRARMSALLGTELKAGAAAEGARVQRIGTVRDVEGEMGGRLGAGAGVGGRVVGRRLGGGRG